MLQREKSTKESKIERKIWRWKEDRNNGQKGGK